SSSADPIFVNLPRPFNASPQIVPHNIAELKPMAKTNHTDTIPGVKYAPIVIAIPQSVHIKSAPYWERYLGIRKILATYPIVIAINVYCAKKRESAIGIPNADP